MSRIDSNATAARAAGWGLSTRSGFRRRAPGGAWSRVVWVCLGLMFAMASRESAAARPPNLVVILADDMGYSDLGCYGGEIRTPNLDRLAAGGLRFTQFYNTSRCWPTRSSLMTGFYAQQIRMDPPKGRLPGWARLLPHHLKPLGYRCYQSGKWHVMGAPKACADGGFDRAYVLEDHDRNFSPRRLVEDDTPLPPVAPGSGYYTTTAFADHSIRCLREHAGSHADQPFFLYLAFTVPHFPLQALPEDIARYAGVYGVGWDTIAERRWDRLRKLGIARGSRAARVPWTVPPWNLGSAALATEVGPGEMPFAMDWSDLTVVQRGFQATKMAIHAAMVDRMDREIGRVLDQIRAMGAWEDTLVLFASDNGASAEILIRGDRHDPQASPGSAASFLCLGPGWSSAANTPFRLHKAWVDEGGTATPLIAHWPSRIRDRGSLRHQVGHVIDLVPTLIALAGGDVRGALPADAPALPGRSLVPALLGNREVPREALFFHHEGHRALRMGDWKVVARMPRTNDWSLYNLRSDRGEQHDVAADQPERVRTMAAEWQRLATQYREDSR